MMSTDKAAALIDYLELTIEYKDDNKRILEFLTKIRYSDVISPGAFCMMDMYKRQNKGLNALLCFWINALCIKLQSGDICVRVNESSIFDVLVKSITKGDEDELNEDFVQKLKSCAKEIYSLSVSYFSCAADDIAGDKEGSTPLVRAVFTDCIRLYFRSFYRYEQMVADFIKKRTAKNSIPLDPDYVTKALNLLFDARTKSGTVNWQKVAAASVTTSDFAVISGGPGTGKTTTVIKLLLLLLSAKGGQNLRVKLAAPTGKAAARMSESIVKCFETDEKGRSQALDTVDRLIKLTGMTEDEKHNLLDSIPKTASTVHSLIGVMPHQGRSRYNRDNPLPCEILIVDEVSMISLGMFSKLIEAVAEGTKVIMLGDKDQLCSVEPGAVLSDICSRLDDENRISKDRLALLSSLTGYSQKELLGGRIADGVTLLLDSFRFDGKSGLGVFAKAVNQASEDDDRQQILKENMKLCSLNDQSFFPDGDKDISFTRVDGASRSELALCASKIADEIFSHYTSEEEEGYLYYLREKLHGAVSACDCKVIFEKLNRYRILCSNRAGVFGVDSLNNILRLKIKKYFSAITPKGSLECFAGQVIIVLKNDPLLGVDNGDVGFVAIHKDSSSKGLKVFFPPKEGSEPRIVSFERLSDIDDGMAMTIHKSQGSEYAYVMMVLPPGDNQVLCKELIYTGITRAKAEIKNGKRLTGGKAAIVGCSGIFFEAVKRRVVRESGLSLMLAE